MPTCCSRCGCGGPSRKICSGCARTLRSRCSSASGTALCRQCRPVPPPLLPCCPLCDRSALWPPHRRAQMDAGRAGSAGSRDTIHAARHRSGSAPRAGVHAPPPGHAYAAARPAAAGGSAGSGGGGDSFLRVYWVAVPEALRARRVNRRRRRRSEMLPLRVHSLSRACSRR
jgi:hypothetical protein